MTSLKQLFTKKTAAVLLAGTSVLGMSGCASMGNLPDFNPNQNTYKAMGAGAGYVGAKLLGASPLVGAAAGWFIGEAFAPPCETTQTTNTTENIKNGQLGPVNGTRNTKQVCKGTGGQLTPIQLR